MADYATEEEQIEALKRWWQENGRSIIFAVVLAVGVGGGWQGWQWYTDTQSEGAAGIYLQVVSEMPMGDRERVVSAADALRMDFSRTTYATLGALAAARMMVRDRDYAGAAEWLQWVLEQSREDDLRAIARVRLARVLGEQGEIDRAVALLERDTPEVWASMHHEIRGDLLAMKGDYRRATQAYEQALATQGRVSDRELVELKLNRVRAGRDVVEEATDS